MVAPGRVSIPGSDEPPLMMEQGSKDVRAAGSDQPAEEGKSWRVMGCVQLSSSLVNFPTELNLCTATHVHLNQFWRIWTCLTETYPEAANAGPATECKKWGKGSN